MREIIDTLNQLNEYVDSTGKYLKPPTSSTPPPSPPKNEQEWQAQLKKERPSTGVNWADDLLGTSGNDTIIGQHADREIREFIGTIESLVAQANGQSHY